MVIKLVVYAVMTYLVIKFGYDTYWTQQVLWVNSGKDRAAQLRIRFIGSRTFFMILLFTSVVAYFMWDASFFYAGLTFIAAFLLFKAAGRWAYVRHITQLAAQKITESDNRGKVRVDKYRIGFGNFQYYVLTESDRFYIVSLSYMTRKGTLYDGMSDRTFVFDQIGNFRFT